MFFLRYQKPSKKTYFFVKSQISRILSRFWLRSVRKTLTGWFGTSLCRIATRDGPGAKIRYWDHVYSNEKTGLEIFPELYTREYTAGVVAKRHKSRGLDDDLGVAKVKTEKTRFNNRQKLTGFHKVVSESCP